ncbi:hypothetical protein PR202_gb19452 [Eleusine coracana subsp. coracana]|uniref:Uncharacterized protein n=1 Tax=Eleusine coracana subsp. coracana TaxID=191504 RepID=A0AAV5FA24_ELECO|nr:hypothetical protein QOZ80_3BG0284570 [Eleusine coracana subsp. coracana]GJN31096.1 hypothetical protein PR202_gb19452 [Eleusine coracana subsp. coracana]
MKCWCVHAPSGGGAMATPPLSARFAPTTTTTLHVPLQHQSRRALKLLSLPRASSSSSGDGSADQEQPPAAATKTATADDAFEERILQIKSRVGPKKRGARKKKGAGGASSSSSSSAVTLPPVPLREAKSRLGAPVEFGFTAYSERLNGALAGLGLAALLLVELGSGQALVKYHQPATLFLQVYTVAAAAAVFVKYEKERISKWPGPAAAKPPAER